jgi:hypothetical protein
MPDKVANAVPTSYNLDPTWYINSAAIDHITSDFDKLTMRENYGGNYQVHEANGSGMTIKAYWSLCNFYPSSLHSY